MNSGYSNICSQKMDKKIWDILIVNGSKKACGEGECIFTKGDTSNGLICLTKGEVKIYNTSLDGKEKIFGILTPPAIFGETETLDKGSRMVCARAISTSEIVILSAEDIERLIYDHPEIALYIIRTIGMKLRWTTVQAEDLSMQKTKYRLARLLLNFEKYGIFTSEEDNTSLYITHEQLANFIGTARPKVTTFLNEFADYGLIDIERGRIIIKNSDGLRDYTHKNAQ